MSMIQGRVDEDYCKNFNAALMQSMIAKKIANTKTFYELKIKPAQFLSQVSLSPNREDRGLNLMANYQRNNQYGISTKV